MHNVVLFGQCFGDPLTIRILALLRQGELCICEIQTVLNQDRAVIDLRLKKLRSSGLVHTRKHGQWIAYRIHTRYVDLVETVFEAYDESIGWDDEVTKDFKLLTRELKKRIDGWCSTSKGRAAIAEAESDRINLQVEDGGCGGEEREPTARRLGLRPCARRWMKSRRQLRQVAI